MYNTVQLLLYLPFVVFFTLTLVLSQANLGTYASVTVRNYVMRDFKSPNMRPVEKITNQDHWRNWVVQNVFEQFLPSTDGIPGQGFPGGSFLVGAVRIRQLRAKAVDSCGFPDVDYPADLGDNSYKTRKSTFFPTWCVPRWPIAFQETEPILQNATSAASLSAEALKAFWYNDCSSIAQQVGDTGYFSTCDGYALDISAHKSQANAAALLDEVMPLWIDVSTRALVVDFFMYNYNDNLFVRTLVLAETTAGGGWNFNVKQDPFRLFGFAPISTESLEYVIVMCFFLLFYSAAFSSFIVATLHSAMHVRYRRSCSWLSALASVAADVWWCVEAATYSLMLGAWLTRFFFMSASSSTVKIYAAGYPDTLVNYAESAFAISIMESLNTFLVYVRIFYFVRLHSRLNILPKTLEKATTYMLSILVISVIVLIAFALAGHIVYGGTVKTMSSVGWSIRTLALTIFENDDFDTWLAANPVWTVIYYSLFTLICVQILFNMITSVLARAYSDAKDERFNPTELLNVASIDSTVLGTKELFPAILYQELRYRVLYFVRKWEEWQGEGRSARNRHADVLHNPYTFYRFMDEATTLLEQGSPRQSAIAAGNLLVTMVMLRQSNRAAADAQERWHAAVHTSPARLQVFGIRRPSLLNFVSSQLPAGAFSVTYYWCMRMPMTFLGVSPVDASADVLESHAMWSLAAQKYLELNSDEGIRSTDDRDEKLGELVGSLSRSAQHIIRKFKV